MTPKHSQTVLYLFMIKIFQFPGRLLQTVRGSDGEGAAGRDGPDGPGDDDRAQRVRPGQLPCGAVGGVL